MSSKLLIQLAKRIPKDIRVAIIEEKLIEKSTAQNVAFEYLFNLHETYLDPSGEHNDFNCLRCKQYVFAQWRRLKPVLEELDKTEAE